MVYKPDSLKLFLHKMDWFQGPYWLKMFFDFVIDSIRYLIMSKILEIENVTSGIKISFKKKFSPNES